MKTTDRISTDPQGEIWDAIIVGCGMGGGALGFELARRGLRVLYVEKGRLLHDIDRAIEDPELPNEAEINIRLKEGRWPRRLRGRTSFGEMEFFAPLGCGTAGSTALYNAQLERFRPSDFRPRENFPDVAEASLPEAWPVTLDEMTPFYRRAEALMGVCGTQDPLQSDPEAELREPPPMTERDQVIFAAMQEAGLHPYRSHVGYNYDGECYECSDICPKACKSDAGNAWVVPALTQHGASILPQCEALEILTAGRRATGLRAHYQGEEITLRARVVAVAGGAYMTPVLLHNSRSSEWPEGLGNSSGLLGRNLMLHTSDFLTVEPEDLYSYGVPRKSITVNDFYFADGQKLGTVQSVAFPLSPLFIEAYFGYMVPREPLRWMRYKPEFFARAAQLGAHYLRRAIVMGTILEDLPYPENRVVADSKAANGMRFEYQYKPELGQRNKLLCQRFAEVLEPKLKVNIATMSENNINFGHPCGTCRFGDDPSTSVLDRNNRVHDFDNLYVVDASFFPSSSGINPSLTIAANALRVAEVIADQ